MQKLLIHKISIFNSPTFKEASFEPSPYFNVFSGASGAGKSVLMESILALFGLRECNACKLEAYLELEGIPEAFEDFIDEGEVVLSIVKKEKVSYFLNAQKIPKKKIQELFSPFLKHLATKRGEDLNQENLIFVLDSYCQLKSGIHQQKLDSYHQSLIEYQKSKKILETIERESLQVYELKEFVRFEIQKLESLAPKEGEYEELLELKKAISKKEKIAQSLQEVLEILSHSHKISNFLDLIGETNSSILESFNELELICERENEYLTELQESNIETILSRLEELSSLKHRYGGVKEALEYLENKKEELKKYENIEENLKEARTSLRVAKEALLKHTEVLLCSRKQYLGDFTKDLNAILITLKMPQVKIELLYQNSLQESLGDIFLSMVFLPNTALNNLSSGEANRLRLALLLIQNTEIKNQAIIILDEIDANLSGEESQGVGEILKKLSSNFQIFAISHQPHMPSLATKHFLVQKQAETSKIIELDKVGRIEEIARMISGKNITKEAIDFATQCLKDLE
ncbi:DNA repair protein RecN [Helicobacter mesocricetorum]|uniref:DNA repair protein n=1 Tax=Helicobacter mesocricetorum TaxID=87012 RepID=UPI000CF11D79|nr:DNA repair protein [Helicobacter mesocricetorum]